METPIAASKARRPDPLSVMWRALVAPQALMLLLGLLALSLCTLSLVPQIPPGAASDPQAWLALQPGVWGSSGRVLWSLGLFDVARAAWFRGLLALTCLVLGARTVEAAELAWRSCGRGRWSPSCFRFWAGGSVLLVSAPDRSASEVQAQVEEHLASKGLRLDLVPGLPVPTVVARGRPWLQWTQPVAQAGLLWALACFAVIGAGSWRSEDWQPRPGEIRLVRPETAASVRLDAFDLDDDDSGRPGLAESYISWLEGEALVKQEPIRTGRPVRMHGVTVRQIGYLPTLRLRGWDEEGRPLAFRADGEQAGIPIEAEVDFASAQAHPRLYLPKQDLFLEFGFDSTGESIRPAVQVYLVRGDASDRWMVSSLAQSGTFFLQGLRLEVHLGYRPILRIARGFGMAWPLGGFCLALFGFALGWLVPARLFWLSIVPERGAGASIRAVSQPGVDQAHIREALTAILRDEAAQDA